MTEPKEEGRSPSPLRKSWLSRLNPIAQRKSFPVPDQRTESPESKAGFLSLLTWEWMTRIIFVRLSNWRVGYQRPLEENDLVLINPTRSVPVITAKLKEAFERKVASGTSRPLLKAIYEAYRADIIIGALCCLLGNLTLVLVPFVLKYLIEFATDAYMASMTGKPGPPVRIGIGYVIGLTCMQILGSIGNNHFMYRGMVVGGQARAALISLIFSKVMTISGRAKAGWKPPKSPPTHIKPDTEEEKKWYADQLQETKVEGWSNGRIINLMSTDTSRIDKAAGWMHMAWASPMAMLVTIALLLVNLTYSALPGIAIFMLSIPFMGMVVRQMLKVRSRANKLTDQRVSLTQEVLQAIRFVKYYAWEPDFLERIGKLRRKEIRFVQILYAMKNGMTAIGTSIPMFASMLGFITFSLTNHPLSPAPVFSSLTLFNQLRLPLMLFPMVLGLISDALTAIQRIESFLLTEDLQNDVAPTDEQPNAVTLVDVSFTWENAIEGREAAKKGKKDTKNKPKKAKREKKKAKKNDDAGTSLEKDVSTDTTESSRVSDPFKIENLNIQIGHHEFLGIVGGVGSGKTSLLAALAGEMRRLQGDAIISGSKAYCPQNAWIQNATVQENIIFGQELDEEKFQRVIDACSLQQDLDILPRGRYSDIGERGVNLSGGQKARVSLARAIYSDANILLMDDPLSAVDAHVGRHIMEHAICGLLKDKCRILATHQLHILNKCDRIILMDDGKIVANDTFDNLVENDERFKAMMTTVSYDQHENVENPVSVAIPKDATLATETLKNSLMKEEDDGPDEVSTSMYYQYFGAAGFPFVFPLVAVLLILSQGANIVTSLWLSWWTSDKFGYNTGTYIGAYAALGVGQAVLLFVYSTALALAGTSASKHLLQRAIKRVLHAPMSFFDTIPLGQIMNRFSKDVDTLDNNMMDSMRTASMTIAQIFSVFILVIAYYYYFAAAVVPLLMIYISIALYYSASARGIQRHESRFRGRVFARFNEAVYGTATIRAYGLAKDFTKNINDAIDQMDSAYFLTFANQRWLAVRLDAIGVILVCVTEILVVTSRFSISPSISGLVLSYLLSSVQMLQFTVRQAADVDNNMNSVERINYYGRYVEQEAPSHTVLVPEEWPSKGEIIFRDVHLRYRPGLPFALEKLDLHVQPGERIGVVGRTGAGKSTIIMALFRMVELSQGSIELDDLDIGTIGLNDLRSRMAIIPQDPTLFAGTVRSNLDPFNTHTDLELWSALRKAHLIDHDNSTDTGNKTGQHQITLESVIEEGGNNFSLGQRQLLALARALVRGSKIIICDEATSSIDFETDLKIQETISDGFSGCTLFCIAHRLKTIIGYDRICVMERGRVAELASPLELYDAGGIFRSMCEQSSITRENIIASRRRD
ncbi:putative oligomycin resistance ATP-dependent permease yor1 [Talaromyces proteolyticus]|uniref:Oligomycin resistance ATP-dependent permease yor1 n=1 Tax=Talaromyces proteolyticus TaxID=1131652 RepID=A0AAD4Q450_9EURO|nr:putative oligomycin resistance ATP-dependent permease yor1 [Talaromyces proteolyticus]KAH8702381.1 putative oligomycin resistance ATP-dependent permease yor1 [Talaromyces proteolyticus]